MELKKIVITGGPCAGKSEAMKWIKREFNTQGYTVLFVPETATELITGGVAPWTCGTNLEYQILQCELQLKKEELFYRAASTMPNDKYLIVCDRGFFDNKAYMTDEEFDYILDRMNLNKEEVLHSYDAVFHLVTAANGLETFYETNSNEARIETPAQAVALDGKLLKCWENHPNHIIIENDENFEAKMMHVVKAIEEFLK